MKRFFAIILSALILTSFAACNNDSVQKQTLLKQKVEYQALHQIVKAGVLQVQKVRLLLKLIAVLQSQRVHLQAVIHLKQHLLQKLLIQISFQMQLWQKMQELCSKMAYIISL